MTSWSPSQFLKGLQQVNTFKASFWQLHHQHHWDHGNGWSSDEHAEHCDGNPWDDDVKVGREGHLKAFFDHRHMLKTHHMAARKKRVCIQINSSFFLFSLSLCIYTHTHTRKHLYPYRHLHLSLYLHLYLDHSRSISTSVSVNPKCHPKYKSFQIIPWKLWVKLILHIRWTHDLHEIRLYKPTATNHLGKFLFASHSQGEIPAMSYFWWFNKCLMVRPSYSHDSTHFPRSTTMCWWYPQ